jgi:hypothetical protein
MEPLQGEVVSLHLFDVGGSFDLAAIERALAAEHRGPPPIGKGTPEYVEFPRPVVVPRPSVPLHTPWGPVEAHASIAYFALGVVSVRFRIPVNVPDLTTLTRWTQTQAEVAGERLALGAAARRMFEDHRTMWEPHVRDRYTKRVLDERYTVFALHGVGASSTDVLQAHGPEVAALLKGESSQRLHPKEVQEALRRSFSYYADDLIVVDWDAALVVDPDADYEDVLFVLEIANLQLLEFRAYDDHLDDLVERSYHDLQSLFRRPRLFRNVRRKAHELSLMRLEISQLADEADNITKFLGDWFLARVYQAAQEKIHLAAWRATVDEKLLAINKLYQLASEETDSNRMIVLEFLIVLLFVMDLAILIWLGL